MRATREGVRDEMTVHVVTRAAEAEREGIAAEAAARLKERLGVRIAVEVASPVDLDGWTEIHTSPKPIRFRDEREPGGRGST